MIARVVWVAAILAIAAIGVAQQKPSIRAEAAWADATAITLVQQSPHPRSADSVYHHVARDRRSQHTLLRLHVRRFQAEEDRRRCASGRPSGSDISSTAGSRKSRTSSPGQNLQGGFSSNWTPRTTSVICRLVTLCTTESRQVGINNRIRWTMRPNADLFVVCNRGWKHPSSEDDRFLTPLSDQFVVKLRWVGRW